ncbi:hypothetical protein CPAR01_03867 [Colletotrichum paranaense]|uniref:Uncharacterized protein n=2 Tax=Colletotrichum acutatum species complex TaxID=2707335 RepID=A0AAI9Z1Q9_9PEZI|nr:uncharacterized protein CCOS01_06023 [Colletotrichum costaricense]XP_060352359.1 uncharacterized protein CPAR01_03867 [Colletotrichum paranaense]KAI3542408.1 hypothetical protein CSPX01_06886 [Colletotrichum filicis]KAK1530920.1 hypothetical protein CCOS01_06023 [Colletotrichum costaricense]KAK1543234.1 hypothetical protein CPAR01_03867 [Colletotrichum paranaense]
MVIGTDTCCRGCCPFSPIVTLLNRDNRGFGSAPALLIRQGRCFQGCYLDPHQTYRTEYHLPSAGAQGCS